MIRPSGDNVHLEYTTKFPIEGVHLYDDQHGGCSPVARHDDEEDGQVLGGEQGEHQYLHATGEFCPHFVLNLLFHTELLKSYYLISRTYTWSVSMVYIRKKNSRSGKICPFLVYLGLPEQRCATASTRRPAGDRFLVPSPASLVEHILPGAPQSRGAPQPEPGGQQVRGSWFHRLPAW